MLLLIPVWGEGHPIIEEEEELYKGIKTQRERGKSNVVNRWIDGNC